MRERRMMKGNPVIVSILGWSGVGKTTFIEAAIAECSRRGIPVAAFKKSRHAADLPPDGKDSSRFHAAGANPSIYLSGPEMLLLTAPPAPMDTRAITALCPQASIIFCEGLDVEGALLVLVAGAETEEKALKRPLAAIDVLVAREAVMLGFAETRHIKAIKPEAVGLFVDYLITPEDIHD
jgi:molybdopterin-guanine dinucleotide biosynthesis protein MobB